MLTEWQLPKIPLKAHVVPEGIPVFQPRKKMQREGQIS
jgi:hypothetical protein